MVPSPRRLPHTISPLEGDGFEPSVPGRETVNPIVGDGTACSKTGADLLGNRKFESISLQQRVGCELDDTITAWRIVGRGGPCAGRRCPAASARSRGRAFVEDV